MTNQEEFLSSTTTDKEKYINAWKYHISQLETLSIPLMNASKEIELYQELVLINERLRELVIIAADEDFK